MTTESYEVIFEGVPDKVLFALLKVIEGNADTLSDLTVSEPVELLSKSGVYKELIDDFCIREEDACLSECLGGFHVSPALTLPSVLLRVVKYGGGTDVELSFDGVVTLGVDGVMLDVQRYASNLSRFFGVTKFYGGLEPAIDVETRYFTNDMLGPLSCAPVR
ncbi:hypothetical protein ACWA6H_21330 [Pseudomonas bijieensis]